jgi:hypothetical protein
MTLKAIEKRIQKIKKEISLIEDMRPGKLSKQFNICGNPTCKCKDIKNPQKHGPYFNLSYTFEGKSKTQFIRPEFANEIEKETNKYRRFKDLVQLWISLSIEKSNIILEEKKSKIT